MRGISAIDIVADEVRSERAAQLGHFDAVETKAGVLLGFAGAITALSSRPIGPLSASGLGAALEALRARHLAADPAFAQIGCSIHRS